MLPIVHSFPVSVTIMMSIRGNSGFHAEFSPINQTTEFSRQYNHHGNLEEKSIFVLLVSFLKLKLELRCGVAVTPQAP